MPNDEAKTVVAVSSQTANTKGKSSTQVEQDYDGYLNQEASQQIASLVGQFSPRAILSEVARQLELNAKNVLSNEETANNVEGQLAYRTLAQVERIRNSTANI